LKIALLTTDNREHHRRYHLSEPYFGTAPEALLQGFVTVPDVQVHVISCAKRAMKSPEKLADNTWFHSLLVPKLGWLRTGYQGCIRAVRGKLKEISPDIVHGQGTERDCAMAAVFSGFSNVVTLHGIMNEQAKLLKALPGTFYWLAARLEKFALRRTDGVLCNSAYTENAVRSFTQRRWRVPNALREAFFQKRTALQAPGKPILLNVGTISPRKQQCELQAAARELHEAGLDFELHFLGPVDRTSTYGRRFLEAVAQNKPFVRYLGAKSLDETISCYDGASAVVHVPSEEAFGLVVAEALARNMKFFGFDVGGIPEIASDIDGSELVPAGDWNGLKNSIRRWIDNGSPRPVSAAAAMRGRYHPHVIAQRHIEIYRQLLSVSTSTSAPR
jgi:glycosyltransferase involved in cell wall biosynthesis